jgi:hypothetical protein
MAFLLFDMDANGRGDRIIKGHGGRASELLSLCPPDPLKIDPSHIDPLVV